ncbi:MAG: class F sortase, partial [Chloroflexota bacterium]
MAVRLLWVGLALLLVGCGASPQQTLVAAATPVGSRASSEIPSATPVPAEIRVYVTGAVARPGVYGLTPDSRVE